MGIDYDYWYGVYIVATVPTEQKNQPVNSQCPKCREGHYPIFQRDPSKFCVKCATPLKPVDNITVIFPAKIEEFEERVLDELIPIHFIEEKKILYIPNWKTDTGQYYDLDENMEIRTPSSVEQLDKITQFRQDLASQLLIMEAYKIEYELIHGLVVWVH